MLLEQVALGCPLRFRETVVKETPEGERIYQLDFGSRTVRLPGFERKLTLVVVAGFGRKPLMLLTTERTARSRKSHWRVVEAYLSRWRVEETIRFIKQSYRLEDIRLLSYLRLRCIATLSWPPPTSPAPTTQTGHPAQARLSGRQTHLRHPRVPLLRHRRRAQEHPLRKRVAKRPLILARSAHTANASLRLLKNGEGPDGLPP